MSGLTVCVPAYKRPGPLAWSLGTVLAQRFDPDVSLRRRLVVLNNDTDEAPVQAALDAAVAWVGQRGWEIKVVHRKPPMDPVLNWYEGIRTYADPDDVVILHGDDDLLPRDSAQVRVRLMERSQADLLLTQVCPTEIWFDGPDAHRVYVSGSLGLDPGLATYVRPAMEDLASYGLAFIGSHCYRANAVFWRSYERSVQLMKTLPLVGTQQLAMLPFFLPIIAAREGMVAGSPYRGCLRGQSLHEIIRLRFGQVTWKPGVLYGATLNLLETGGLGSEHELEPLRAQIRRELVRWYVPTMRHAETRKQLASLGRTTPLQFRRGDARDLAYGATSVVKGELGLVGLGMRLRTRFRLRTRALNRDEMLAALE